MSEQDSVSIDEGLKGYSVTKVYAHLAQTGWFAPEAPRNKEHPDVKDASASEPRLPHNLDTMSLSELREVQAEFGAWYEYIMNEKLLCMVSVKALEAQLDHVKAVLKIDIRGAPVDRSAAIIRNPSYVEINQKLVHQDILMKAAEIRRDRIKNSLDIISRQATMLVENRPNRWGDGED